MYKRQTYEATEVIVNSNFMKGHVQGLFGLPFDKINVVPNGINTVSYTHLDVYKRQRRIRYTIWHKCISIYLLRPPKDIRILP